MAQAPVVFHRSYMYIVVIAWFYVAVLMAVAEATSSTGTVLGAIITFFLYGLLPIGIVVYVMGSPLRKKARLAAEALADARASESLTRISPDESSHPAGSAEADRITSVGKKP